MFRSAYRFPAMGGLLNRSQNLHRDGNAMNVSIKRPLLTAQIKSQRPYGGRRLQMVLASNVVILRLARAKTPTGNGDANVP